MSHLNNHRRARIGDGFIKDYDSIKDYRRRRAERLAARGIKINEYRRQEGSVKLKDKELMKGLSRMDAPDEEEQNNNNQTEGHGNTRLPFGLCKRFEIEIGEGWGPREAWDALAGKGITAEGAYGRLKKGEDPGTPPEGGDEGAKTGEEKPEEEPEGKPEEKPKEPVKVLRDEHGTEVYDLGTEHVSWSKTNPYRLTGTISDTDGRRFYKRFMTKGDMMWFLKQKGIEEIMDPETGEIVNPQEMEFPEKVFLAFGWDDRLYHEPSIGMRGDRYAVSAKDMDGKKRALGDFSSFDEAKAFLVVRGLNDEDIKLSPAMKKREKERTAWLTSDKKEYIEREGVKYGDVRVKPDPYGGYDLTASSEDGKKMKHYFTSKAKMEKFLKDQGVERCKIDGEFVNPQEFEVPESVARVNGEDYQKLYYKENDYGDLAFYGKDLDGKEKRLYYQIGGESFEEFQNRIKLDLGDSYNAVEIDEETQKKIDDRIEKDREMARRKAEFEAKAVTWGKGRYSDIDVKIDDDGDLKITGYDEKGRDRIIDYPSDMAVLVERCEKNGIDPESIIKDEEVKKRYEEYKKFKEEFDTRAEEIDGTKYADVELMGKFGYFVLHGKDIRGRDREIYRGSYDEIEKFLQVYTGKEPTQYPMNDRAKEIYDHVMKTKEALASGEYHDVDGEAYKDMCVFKDEFGNWSIMGRDVDGELKDIEIGKTYDEAIDFLESEGITDYTIKHFGDDEGKFDLPRPENGMRKVVMLRKPDGSFLIMATTGKDTVGEVHTASSEEEARSWLKDHGVDDSTVKTKGMNPNDDVPRVHTAKSLEKFDTHRAEHEEEYDVLRNMTDAEKQEVVDMMTELFNNGQYRMWRDGHFEDIVLGRFKSTLETGTSGGAAGQSTRRYTERMMLGLEGHDDEDGEKYGYLGHDDDLEAFESSIAKGYGGGDGVLYKFKKDAVQDRTTYTAGDSLDSYPEGADRPLAGYAGPRPTYEGISAMRSAYLKDALTAYRDYKAGKITYSEFLNRFSRECRDGYLECHYHGNLSIDDVESITMSRRKLIETFKHMSPETRQKIVTRLKERGIMLQVGGGLQLEDGYQILKEEFDVE
jgi:hypothetical protein